MPIAVENLTHVYMPGTPFEKVALDNINLSIQDGEFLGIIGHTGSGKSTLVQHFNGLLKPSSGRVLINSLDTSGRNVKELRKQVGMVFQYPEHQLFEETVYKDIAFGLVKQGITEAEAEARIRETAEQVGLREESLEKSPFELSGGQKRRAAIAGILIMKPQIMVLDEPTAGLDPAGRDEIFGIIRRLHETSGITVILVSHSMEDIARLVDRVVVMNKGKVEMDGHVSEVFGDIERLESIGLSAPQISYLMKRLKEAVPGLNDRIYTLGAAKEELLRFLAGRGNRP